MEPDAIWIYHPKQPASFERITPEDARKKGWYLTPDCVDEAPIEEKPAKVAKVYTCEKCGKEFSHHLAHSGHVRSCNA